MTRTTLEVAGNKIKYKNLRYSDFVSEVGNWSAELDKILNFKGFSTIEIKKDEVTEFKGRIQQPGKNYGEAGPGMSIGGPEWTARLIDHKTPHAIISSTPIDDALNVILQDSSFSKGEVDDFESPQDPFEWDASLEFMEFDFNNVCIVFMASVEVTSESSTDDMDLPLPPLRGCFWYDGATRRFYVVAYDKTANQLKYNFTRNGETWNGWNTFSGATPGANEGQGGFAVVWRNSKVYLIVDDGANIDFWRGTINDGTGVITLSKIKDNLDTGDLVLGPFFDGDDHVWCCVNDGVNYVFWESTDNGSNWNNRFNANDVPKYAFDDDTAADILVIEYDSVAKDVEEWIWVQSGSNYQFREKIADINENTMGRCSGFQDKSLNLFLVWEDVHAGGDADIYFNHRYQTELYSIWGTAEKVVDDANFAADNFCLSGDDAANLYLFWKKKGAGLQISRRFEGSFEAAVELDSDCYASDGISSPETGMMVFAFWKDSGEDAHFLLLSPYGLAIHQKYTIPDFINDFEDGLNWDEEHITSGETLAPSSEWSVQGTFSQKSTLNTDEKNEYAWGKDTGLNTDRIWARAYVKVTQNGIVNNGHKLRFISFRPIDLPGGIVYCGWYKSAGVIQWHVLLYEGDESYHTYLSGITPDINTEYCVELGWYKHDTEGFAKLYVNDSLIINATGKDTNTSKGNVGQVAYGLSSLGLGMNPSTAYVDSCMHGESRIGPKQTGYFKTDQYDATGGLLRWGTLSSPQSNTYDTIWSVLRTSDEAVLADNLNVPANLDDEGVPPTETSIKIRADMTGRIAESINYVYEIHLSEVQGAVDMETDYENCYRGISKAAKMLNAEFKLNYSDKVNFKHQLGSDKSDVVIFKTARSAGYDYDVEINVRIVKRVPDYQYFANCIKILGSGDYPDRVEAEAKNYTSISELAAVLGGSHNGEIWITIRDDDLVTTGMAQNRANNEVAARSSPRERITLEVLDDYEAGLIRRGDTVMVVDENTGLKQAVRIVGTNKAVDEEGNQKTTLEVIARMRLTEYIQHLVSVDNVLRWA